MILNVCLIVIIAILLRAQLINSFKIAYYRQKLINRNVDISDVDKIGLISILKL